MIKSKILTILPLTENFSKSKAGAVSLFLKDNNKYSKFKNFVVGSTHSTDLISNNYKNFIINRSFFSLSKNISYAKKIVDFISKNDFKIIEVHNRPQIAIYLLKNGIKNISIFFHNDPLNLRKSNKIKERKYLLENCKNIFFNSKWTKKRFFHDFKNIFPKKTYVIYQGISKKTKFNKKLKIITFAGKLNKSKGFDIFCESIINILDVFPDWKAIVIGDEPREKFNYHHKNLKYTGWIEHNKVINIFKKSSILVANSSWEEPFGRVAVEGAATGNVVIMTKKGGLPETTKIKILLKKNNTKNLTKELKKLIDSPKNLLKMQKLTFNNFEHHSKKIISKLDKIRVGI